MARKGLFSKVQPGASVTPDVVSRLQDNVSLAVNQLTADDDLIRSPVVRFVAGGAIPATAAVVVYAGGPGQTLTLPLAAAQGANVGAIVHLLNTSASSVTLARVGMDLVGGGASVTLAAGGLMVLASDGQARWCKAP